MRLSENLQIIKQSTFESCKVLQEITIPASVQVIHSNAFYNAYNKKADGLQTIRFMGNAPLITNTSFYNVTATAYYSAENTSWSEDVKLNYGGTLTWEADANISNVGGVAEAVIVDSGTAGDNITWKMNSKGVLTISGEGEIISAPWLEAYASVIKKVVVEDGVTSLCTRAFSGCVSMVEIELADSVQSVGYECFSGCHVLFSC